MNYTPVYATLFSVPYTYDALPGCPKYRSREKFTSFTIELIMINIQRLKSLNNQYPEVCFVFTVYNFGIKT